MALFGKTKVVDEETRQDPDGTEDEGPKDPTFFGLPLLGTSGGGPRNVTESGRHTPESPQGRPPARTDPSTYSTIITTDSGKSEPGFQSIQFIDGH